MWRLFVRKIPPAAALRQRVPPAARRSRPGVFDFRVAPAFVVVPELSLTTMISDPIFYAFAIPAVIVTGLGKGGFGGALAMLSVPIMSLAIAPLTAAAIMLPILVVMDISSLIIYRRSFDATLLKIMMPATAVGVGMGYLTASLVDSSSVRLLVGLMALGFTLDYWFRPKLAPAKSHSRMKGTVFGTIAGFTSFVSHTGGPPFQIYALPLRLERTIYIGSTVILFAYINALKLIPYFLLGQFSTANLATSALLLPLAPAAIWAGARLVRLVPQETFYTYIYALMFVISLKLIWDGATALLWG